MQRPFSRTRTPKGFTLVELAVVIVIIGVLAAFGVPRYLKSVERSKASEAFHYLSSVRSAEERYNAQQGAYSTDLTKLDMQMPAPKYFTNGGISAGSTGNIQTSWSMTLTRSGNSAGYGAYQVTFTDQGFDPSRSTIPVDISPVDTTGGTGK